MAGFHYVADPADHYGPSGMFYRDDHYVVFGPGNGLIYRADELDFEIRYV